ncbi:MAG: 16S rRNA (cytosine(967)-C(5))-methyltransferase RsmB [Oscillospiraceae bacterium]|nr:16S rRNA (cytosine(967)-C(5))-methyltransferase RsmB [Oscillospiraceae bacterium]
MDAREVALLTLNACERQGGWSDGVLKKQLSQAGLDSRDAGLATQLCFGVLQNKLLLDFYLSQFSNTPLKRMEAKVVQLLRIGLYQMLFLTRVPHSAAVNSAVELTRQHCKNPRASGMVNGILRALERSLDRLPTIPNTDKVQYLSTLYSHPNWLVEQWLSELGEEETTRLLAANNAAPPITAQVNTCRISSVALLGRLSDAGVDVQMHPWLKDCLVIRDTGDLERLDSFRDGLFYIQDPASRLAVMAADARPGMRVLDACAAPGGKSFALSAAMGNRGEVLSCDLHPHKKKLMQAGAQRLGLDCMKPQTADATVFRAEWENGFDLVVADVPCSGLGVIRKKPDIRYKDPESLADLPQVQKRILDNVCRYVKPGGVLLYSTCTLLERENRHIVETFLGEHSEFALEAFALPEPVGQVEQGMLTLWPHRHDTDGFFFAKLRRKA